MSEEKNTNEEVKEAAETAENTVQEAEVKAEATEETKVEETTETSEEVKEEAAEETPAEEVQEEANPEEKEAESAIPEAEEIAEEEAVELPHRDIRPGMLVRVHERIIDVNSKGEEKQRTQVFEGLVMGLRSAGESRTMTVRKNSKGWMVEKIFPLSSPNVEKVEVVKTYRTRRAKLSYLRGRFRRKLREQK